MELVFERGTRNAPRINYSDEGQMEVPIEIKIGTQVLKEKEILVFKYVDDNVLVEKLNFGQVVALLKSGKFIKEKCAFKTQNAFRFITGNAEVKGMVVNSGKTQILVISDALNYTPVSFIVDKDQVKLNSSDKIKILGFEFGNKPTMQQHVESVILRLRRKVWMLRHLKKLGFNEPELLKVYTSHIRPSADYCDVVYHSSLTDDLDERLERAQVGALRAIYSYKLSGRKLRELANVDTLRERRIKHCDKFAQKCADSDRFKSWFPLKTARSARGGEKYVESYARCDRLLNSPLFYMRRRLNGKVGRTYGERNREFRE